MDDEAVVDWKGLKEKFNLPWSRSTIWRWMKRGAFPGIINPGKHRSTHPIWRRRDIVEWLNQPCRT
ncbi:hypothetical protein JJE66_33880 [Bradyrhizobium diazoefficiens]|uniref:helix-turn-helix transcriptional regulator n=1 Tax=Bradyrhizobium diazoefficiens TaxID=1355477 RepID=UPI00190C4E69|nr:hypothetical protein [Bradyrhizobium diazoefficiens]MBK3666199.1 hypothetical protein [Bradyrhizobium diazoefficiens]